MIILLIGIIGSGKTSVGLKLSKELKMKYYEMDELVYRHTGVVEDSKIKDSLWKECQLEISKDLSTQDNIVISCSGDIVENNLNFIYFQENSYDVKIVMLDANEDTIASRLKVAKNTDKSTLQKKINKLIQTRSDSYKSLADLVVDTSNVSVDEVVESIMETIQKTYY